METNPTNGSSNIHFGPDQPLPESQKPKEELDHAKEERWQKVKDQFDKVVDDLKKHSKEKSPP